ncbi:MAG: ABC transporter ATP-binding protein [Vicinamibacterales bacterium]
MADDPLAARRRAILAVEHLSVTFDVNGRAVHAVNDVSFQIDAGETLCLVGESGSGKSLTALSILRLVDPPGRIEAGRVLFDGRDLLALDERAIRTIRGAAIGFVFQEPATAFNPLFTIGSHIEETLAVHGVARGRAARARAVDLLEAVSIPDPDRRAREYPHQLSGGLRQRALIALALACNPRLLIADEPTTALDVTIQAQILDLLLDLRRRFTLTVLLITHDLGVVARMADRVAVMYAGRIVEEAPVRDVFHNPRHPYTRALLASIPGGPRGSMLSAIPGSVPSLALVPPGCAFAPRCVNRFDPCAGAVPGMTEIRETEAVGRDPGSVDRHPDPRTTDDGPRITPYGPRHVVRCYLYSSAIEPDACAEHQR